MSGLAALVQGCRVQSTNHHHHYLSVANKNIFVLWQSSVVPSTVTRHAFQAFSENQTGILTDFPSKFIFTLLHSFCIYYDYVNNKKGELICSNCMDNIRTILSIPASLPHPSPPLQLQQQQLLLPLCDVILPVCARGALGVDTEIAGVSL